MAECRSLSEIRGNIDRLDQAIADLLGQRADLVRQAAGFKDSEAAVVVPERIEEIIVKVRAAASREGADADLMEALYRSIINVFIEFERIHWRQLRK